MIDAPRQPLGEITIQTLAMPADTNPSGDNIGKICVTQGTFIFVAIDVNGHPRQVPQSL